MRDNRDPAARWLQDHTVRFELTVTADNASDAVHYALSDLIELANEGLLEAEVSTNDFASRILIEGVRQQ